MDEVLKIMNDSDNAEAISTFIDFEFDSLSSDVPDNDFKLYLSPDRKIFYDIDADETKNIMLCDTYAYKKKNRFDESDYDDFDKLKKVIEDIIYDRISNILYRDEVNNEPSIGY